jgi:hypothetical protein
MTHPPVRNLFNGLRERGLGVIWCKFERSPAFDRVNATSEQRRRFSPGASQPRGG